MSFFSKQKYHAKLMSPEEVGMPLAFALISCERYDGRFLMGYYDNELRMVKELGKVDTMSIMAIKRFQYILGDKQTPIIINRQ